MIIDSYTWLHSPLHPDLKEHSFRGRQRWQLGCLGRLERLFPDLWRRSFLLSAEVSDRKVSADLATPGGPLPLGDTEGEGLWLWSVLFGDLLSTINISQLQGNIFKWEWAYFLVCHRVLFTWWSQGSEKSDTLVPRKWRPVKFSCQLGIIRFQGQMLCRLGSSPCQAATEISFFCERTMD